jgi:exopolysaccharide biosynthesis polyprenyl glycosylphosphotransferase
MQEVRSTGSASPVLDALSDDPEAALRGDESQDSLWEMALSDHSYAYVRRFRFAIDLAAVCLAIGLAFLGRFYFQWLAVNIEDDVSIASHILASFVWGGGFLLAAAGQQLYDEDTIRPEGGDFPRLVKAALEAGAVLSIFVFFSHSLSVSRAWFGMVVVFTLFLVPIFRSILERRLRKRRIRGLHLRPLLVVAEEGATWPEALFRDAPEFKAVGRLTKEQAKRYLDERGRTAVSESRGRRQNPTLLLKAADYQEEEMWQLILDAGLVHCPVFVHSDVRAVGRSRLVVREVANNTIVKITPPRLTGFQALTKRIFDLVASVTLLILSIPLVLTISVSILVTMGWPIFFIQERAGKDGRTFKMIKFRTMKNGAEAPDSPVRAIKDDPRRTTLGRMLRRTSFDELPQLLNVLLGHMSLVGPRPEMALIASGLEQDIRYYGYRHRIRPGITGWAQTRGLRGDTSIHDRVGSDNWYIEHWSLPLDIRIMFQTLREVVRGENAY